MQMGFSAGMGRAQSSGSKATDRSKQNTFFQGSPYGVQNAITTRPADGISFLTFEDLGSSHWFCALR